MEQSEPHDLENPLIPELEEEESKELNDPNIRQLISKNGSLLNFPNSLQQKYGKSRKIKWVFNQMLKMSFSQDTLVTVFSHSISLDEQNHSKEEILNLAIDTYLASEFELDNNENFNSSPQSNPLINSLDINKPEGLSSRSPQNLYHRNKHQIKIDFQGDPNHRCGICFMQSSEQEKSNIPRCEHGFCSKCVFDYISNLVINGRVATIMCPNEGCNNILSDIEIIEFLKSDDALIKKYQKFKKDLDISMDPIHRWCIRPGCEFLVEGNPKNPKSECKCGQVMCFNCMNPWHEGKDCESAIDNEYKRYAEKGKVKNCPKCNSRIEKNEGCNHIHCTRCKYDFCWLCDREYKPGHYEWYNLLGCPMMMYTRLNNSKFHSSILCLKKIALIFALILGIILVASLVVALFPLVLVLFAMFVPVMFYVKICEPRKDFKGIFIGIIIFIVGVPLSPFILLVMIVPGICIMTCCRNQFDEIYL